MRILGIATGLLIFLVSLVVSTKLLFAMNRHRIDLQPGAGALQDSRRNILKPENYSPEGQRILRRFRIVHTGIAVGVIIIAIFVVLVK